MLRQLTRPLACLLLLCSRGAREAEATVSPHPRLLFTRADVPALRAKVRDGGDDDRAYASILARWPHDRDSPLDSLLSSIAGLNVMSELGLMAHLEGDGKQQESRARELALHLVRTREVDTDDFESSLRLRTLALGYDMAFDGASAAERVEARSEIQSYLAFMPGHFNYYRYARNPFTSNRGVTVGSSMGLAVITIWDDVPELERPGLRASLEFADELVQKCLTDILPSDGAYREGVLYGAWTMRMALPYIEARRRFDGTDLATDPRFERMAEWLVYEVLPEGGGRTNNLNDSPWFSRPLAVNSTYLDWAQTRYGSSLARWLYRHVAGDLGWNADAEDADRTATVLWNRPLPDVDPGTLLPSGRLFAQRGLYFYRSAWTGGATGDEILFSLQAGRFLGGHAQEDQGQFTLYAHGDRYAVDNGSAYPTTLPKETEAHNLVLIDGRGQHNAGRSIGTDARIAMALLAPFCDYVRAELDSAYDTHSPYNDPGLPFPGTDWSWGYDGGNPVLQADRLLAVVKGGPAPAWMLLADDIRKDGSPHDYEWLLHTDPANRIDLASDPVTIRGARSRLLVWFANPRPPDLQLSFAPFANGGEDPATLRLVARVRAIAPRYVVALVPLPDSIPDPAVSLTQQGGLVGLRLAWGAVEDVATFNPTDSLCAGEVETDGKMSVVRVAGTGIVGYALAEGRTLRYGSLDLLELGTRASGALSGESLQLSRDDVPFAAYGPAVNRVLGPSGERPFERDGPWVRSPTVTEVAGAPRGPRARLGDRRHPIRIDCSPAPGRPARVTIHDVRGRLVRALSSETLDGSGNALLWDGTDLRVIPVSPGLYLVRMLGCSPRRVGRIVLLP